MTSTTEEIITAASNAINATFAHYFVNLAAGQEKTWEATEIANILIDMQGWLLFSEESLAAIQRRMTTESGLTRNLIWSLTTIFNTRFVLSRQDYASYIGHLATSFDVSEHVDENITFMAKQYRERVTAPQDVINLLTNNRHLVMLTTMYLFLETEIIATSVTGKPRHE